MLSGKHVGALVCGVAPATFLGNGTFTIEQVGQQSFAGFNLVRRENVWDDGETALKELFHVRLKVNCGG